MITPSILYGNTPHPLGSGIEFLPLTEAVSNCSPDVTIATLTSAMPSRSLPTVTSRALLFVDDCSVLSSGLVALVTSNNPGFLNCEPTRKRNTLMYKVHVVYKSHSLTEFYINCKRKQTKYDKSDTILQKPWKQKRATTNSSVK